MSSFFRKRYLLDMLLFGRKNKFETGLCQYATTKEQLIVCILMFSRELNGTLWVNISYIKSIFQKKKIINKTKKHKRKLIQAFQTKKHKVKLLQRSIKVLNL